MRGANLVITMNNSQLYFNVKTQVEKSTTTLTYVIQIVKQFIRH